LRDAGNQILNDAAAAELSERTGKQRPYHKFNAGPGTRQKQDIFDLSRRARPAQPIIPGAQDYAAALFIVARDASRAGERRRDRPELGGKLSSDVPAIGALCQGCAG
jgi:hypothetical protein